MLAAWGGMGVISGAGPEGATAAPGRRTPAALRPRSKPRGTGRNIDRSVGMVVDAGSDCWACASKAIGGVG